MAESIFLPIKTERLVIDEFKTSDFHRLQEIAFNINHNADLHAGEGYCPFYTFQVDKDTPDRDNVIRNKVSDFLIKADRERKQEPRSTYRMAVRLPNGMLIGNATVDMLPIEENGKKIYGDLGYFIDPKFGAHGYATEAVRGLYGHGEPRAVFEVHKEDFYRSSPFYQKMPNLLTLLINRQRGKK